MWIQFTEFSPIFHYNLDEAQTTSALLHSLQVSALHPVLFIPFVISLLPTAILTSVIFGSTETDLLEMRQNKSD